MKALLRSEFIVLLACLKKQEKPQIHNLTLHLKEQEKWQRKPKLSRKREIINADEGGNKENRD